MMKKRRRKFERKELHPDLITMWRHADEICAPPVSRARHASLASPYPRVDWTRVNQRNLANLPKPQYYPVHGCAQDPTFYEPRKSPCPLGNPLRSLYDEAGAIPFGSELGFRTQAGVIAPGSHGEFVSGYWLHLVPRLPGLGPHGHYPQGQADQAGLRLQEVQEEQVAALNLLYNTNRICIVQLFCLLLNLSRTHFYDQYSS